MEPPASSTHGASAPMSQGFISVSVAASMAPRHSNAYAIAHQPAQAPGGTCQRREPPCAGVTRKIALPDTGEPDLRRGQCAPRADVHPPRPAAVAREPAAEPRRRIGGFLEGRQMDATEHRFTIDQERYQCAEHRQPEHSRTPCHRSDRAASSGRLAAVHRHTPRQHSITRPACVEGAAQRPFGRPGRRRSPRCRRPCDRCVPGANGPG